MPSAPPLTISLMLYFGFEGDQRSVAANVWAADGHAAALPAELRHMNMRELHFTHTVPMQVIRHSFVSPTASQTRPKTSEIRPSDHIDINVNATKLAEISEILNDQDVALVCRFPDDSGRSGGAGRSWNTLIACTSKAQREQLPPGVEPISSGPTLILFTARMPPPPSTEPGRITNLISQAVNEYVHKHNKDIKSQNKDIRPRPIDAAALHHVRVASLVWKLDDIRGKIGQGYNIVFSGAISNHFWEPQTMRHVFTVCEGRSRAELGEDKVWNAPIVNVFIVNGAREHIAALEVKSPLAPHLCRAKRSTNINFYTFGFAPHLPEEICDVLTIAFPPRSGGIVALSLSAILAAIAPAPTTEGTNGKREVEEGEISSTPTLSPQKRSPPGVSLWALRDRLSPQWTVVLHPWVLAVLNHYLDSGRVPQLMEQLGLLPPEGSVPLDVLLDLENKLSELTSPLQPEEIAAPPFDDPPKPEPDDDPLPAIEELDKELYKTMILLQERSINEKRYHVVLAHNGMLAGESSSNGIEVLSLDKFTTEPFLDDE